MTTVYGNAPLTAANKEWDWESDDIRLALVTSAYTPDQGHAYWSVVVANDMAASGDYTANGVVVPGRTATYAAGVTKLAASSWSVGGVAPVSGSFRYGVIYSRTPATDATRPLIAFLDFGLQIASASLITVTWSGLGIVSFTVAA